MSVTIFESVWRGDRVIGKWRTARAERRCDGEAPVCGGGVYAGDRYLASAVPPSHPDNADRKWWTHSMCPRCCDWYGIQELRDGAA